MAKSAVVGVSYARVIRGQMSFLILSAGTFAAIAFAVQIASILVVILRLRKLDGRVVDDTAIVSVIRPLCGIENFIEETLRSTFLLDYPRYEIVFCFAGDNDPAIPIVQGLIAAHPHIEARLLIGNAKISGNPKLNNVVKGWHASRGKWVLMADSNVLMPKDHIRRMLSAWRNGTGLVCSPPIGSAPQNLWAEMECAFLNTYQARWQFFADSIGLGFAQGKSMLWRRNLLDFTGGIEALAGEVAEDAAATKIVRGLGLRVRLVTSPFVQPLGYRSAADVWHRQVRWARLRRKTFPWFFGLEILVGAVPPLAMGTFVATASGWPVIDIVAPLAAIWYAAEAYLAHNAGWHFFPRSILICMLRDILLPVLWVFAWTSNDFEWRGNSITMAIDSPSVS
jgi:ceramide glucosyltransferase